jgi:hypothetical protein
MDFTLQLMELLSFLEPATVSFQQKLENPLKCITGEGLTALLMQFGYFFQEPATILKFYSPLHARPADCVRLGPGAASRFGKLRTLNFSTPTGYHERIQTSGRDLSLIHRAPCAPPPFDNPCRVPYASRFILIAHGKRPHGHYSSKFTSMSFYASNQLFQLSSEQSVSAHQPGAERHHQTR